MNLIDRYIYAVSKSFTGKQRDEIEKELRANIEDMIELNQSTEPYENKVKAVLLELGDPEIIAEGYRGSKRYLIGPGYYETYTMVLKIVLAAVLGGVSIAFLIQSFLITTSDIVQIVINYISTLFNAALQASAWTTIAFIIAERVGSKKAFSQKGKWNLAQLPVVPHRKAVIPLSESIISILFTTIFYSLVIVLLYSAPGVFAAYIPRGDETIVIPLFNVDVIQEYGDFFIAIFILSILKEMLKLYYRRWMLKLSLMLIVLTVISTALTLIIFTDVSIWNPDFSTQLVQSMNLNFDFISLWQRIKTWFIAVIIFAGVIEIITVLVRGIKYNRNN